MKRNKVFCTGTSSTPSNLSPSGSHFTKLNEVKTDPMGPVADVLIVAAELADNKLFQPVVSFTIHDTNSTSHTQKLQPTGCLW